MKKIIPFLISFALIFGAISGALGQQKVKRTKLNKKPLIAKNTKSAVEPKSETPTSANPQIDENLIQAAIPPNWKIITLDLKPKASEGTIVDKVLSGSVAVNVSENGNTFIKVGLANRAVTLLDFPSDDPVYKIHPGNENFVTVGCFGREPNGKCLNSPTDAIVLRPGKDFHTMGDLESASTVITIQRASGIVVTVLVVPVKSIAENTNYVAVQYSTREIIESRKKAGLSVNLVPDGASALNSEGTKKDKKTPGENNSPSNIIDASIKDNQNNQSANVQGNELASDKTLSELLEAEIQRVAANSSAYKFSKPVYGISLARATGELARVKDVTIEVIAVRNTLGVPVRLVNDQPELAIENKDSKETSINVQKLSLLHIATTADGTDVLEPGRIYYYAIAYQTPILGVRQVIRVSFAQREAADAPTTLELSGISH